MQDYWLRLSTLPPTAKEKEGEEMTTPSQDRQQAELDGLGIWAQCDHVPAYDTGRSYIRICKPCYVSGIEIALRTAREEAEWGYHAHNSCGGIVQFAKCPCDRHSSSSDNVGGGK